MKKVLLFLMAVLCSEKGMANWCELYVFSKEKLSERSLEIIRIKGYEVISFDGQLEGESTGTFHKGSYGVNVESVLMKGPINVAHYGLSFQSNSSEKRCITKWSFTKMNSDTPYYGLNITGDLYGKSFLPDSSTSTSVVSNLFHDLSKAKKSACLEQAVEKSFTYLPNCQL